MPRKKKATSPNPGLTPPGLREQIKKQLGVADDVAKVPKVRRANSRPKEPVVPESRSSTLADTCGGGIFGAVDVQDDDGSPKTEPQDIPDDRGVTPELIGMRDLLEIEIKKINPEEGVSYLRCIVKQVVTKAARGEQKSMDFIRDLIEGRPGQAPSRPVRMEDVEKQLEAAEVNLLNKFAQK